MNRHSFHPSVHMRGWILTLTAGVCWGISGVCGEYLMNRFDVPPPQLTAVRMLLAGIILVLAGWLRMPRSMIGVWKSRRDVITLLVFAIFGLLFCQVTYLTAISHSNAGTATVLQYLAPLLLVVFACIRSRRWPKRLEILCLFLALIGTFFIATRGNFGNMVLTREGLAWGLAAAVGLASYTLIPTRIIRKWGSVPVTGYGLLIGGAVMAVVSRVWTMPLMTDWREWVALAGLVVFGTVFSFTLYLQGISLSGATKASMLACIEPVTATLFSVLLMGTAFSLMELMGFVFILSNVFILARQDKQ